MDVEGAAVERVSGEEESPQVDEQPINTEVIVAKQVPTIQVPIRSATGKVLRVREVVDKSAIFALPGGELRGRAAIFNVRPSGRVLIFDKNGKLLARFNDGEQAVKHLGAAKVEAHKLIGFPKPEKKAAKK